MRSLLAWGKERALCWWSTLRWASGSTLMPQQELHARLHSTMRHARRTIADGYTRGCTTVDKWIHLRGRPHGKKKKKIHILCSNARHFFWVCRLQKNEHQVRICVKDLLYTLAKTFVAFKYADLGCLLLPYHLKILQRLKWGKVRDKKIVGFVFWEEKSKD